MQTDITIRGIPVSFPFQPYELQKEYMGKVIECLQNETNGVLESPTGTGKTLSLLCSSLAWLTIKKAQVQAQRRSVLMEGETDIIKTLQSELDQVAGKSTHTSRAFLGLPTIIYSSRTHSQLSQAMQELKTTAYSYMKATVIGSRDMMCIHPDVTKEQQQSAKINLCRAKVQTRTCHFYNRLERKKEDPAITQQNIVDIEDLIKIGQTHKCCPYFLAKELKQQADIIFMPYNYLLDSRARKALGIELSNNIVILDEAHNIERICEESASLQIKTTDIALCIEEVTEVMKAMVEEPASFNSQDTPKDFTADELCVLKQMLLDFEKALDEVEVKGGTEGTTFEGNYIFDILKNANIGDNNNGIVISLIEKIVQFLSTVREGPFQRKGNGLQLFEDMLRIVFASASPDFKKKIAKCYKVHITIEEPKKKMVDTWLSKASLNTKRGCRVLSYWCFSPGFGMNMLMQQGVKCVILTSGTLAPLRPLISELELDVGVRLENPHIVTEEQVCVKIITKGPDMEPLNCSFQNRDNPKFVSSLGRSIVNLTRIIPDGLLIFFPSYPIMQKCQTAWQEEGIWSNINEQKQIYVEPKDKDAFHAAMSDYYAKIRDPNSRGAIFMGVCRGKVSEGLDFADMNGRAVIIIGLPYPPLKDPRIILKKRYLDICNANDKEFLKGDEWYSLEASRAVNQAIGRVIRHQKDYGAILLLDSRFNSPRIKSQMSLWLRNHVKLINNFGEIVRDLSRFYRNAEVKFPCSEEKKKYNTALQTVPAELETSNTYKKGSFFNFSPSSSITSSNNLSSTSGLVTIHKRTPAEPLVNPAKRKKISLVTNSTATKDNKRSDIKEYIVMVKKSLNPEDFQEFIKAVGVYKDKSDFSDFIKCLDTIFLNKNHSLRFIIQGLSPYIKSHHKTDFENYWEKMR